MKQDSKELLLKDLSSRLPYGVMLNIIYDKFTGETFNARISTIDYCGEVKVRYGFEEYERAYSLEQIKPYLLPISSMTEEQKREYNRRKHEIPVCRYEYGEVVEKIELYDSPYSFDYLIENHFDAYDLIPMGLAIDASGLNLY